MRSPRSLDPPSRLSRRREKGASEARGLGDPLFSKAGNPGYDVSRYDLDLPIAEP